jgi:hypothetical protein
MLIKKYILISLIYILPRFAISQDAIVAGDFITEPPTLINLGFEWHITGDNNRNAIVNVSYRKTGSDKWEQALPLMRAGGERVFRKTEFLDYTVPPFFAGSILDLTPDTEYECRFILSDINGVQGDSIHIVKVKTRAAPKAAEDGRVLHVYPVDWKGPMKQPAFLGLKAAYYGSGLGDWSVVSERKVRPGDIILVHAGTYKADRLNYVEPNGLSFNGTYVLTGKGTAERPIVIRGAGDGEVIFDGAGAYNLFDVTGSQYNIFEGLTIKNTDVAFAAGLKEVAGATGLTIRNCRIEEVGIALTCEYAGSKNFYIADNVIIGRDDRYRLRGWANPGIYPPTQLHSYNAIKVYGSGHVICYNAIAYFHDAICISTYGTPEKEQDLKAVSIDIYNNDLHLLADDFIESDGGVHNIRVMRNRGVNAGQCGLSAQPVFGGPAYFIRNVLYHIPNGCALKFMSKPSGLYVLHNTIIAENGNRETYSNAYFRNNLFLGTDKSERAITVFPMATAYSSYDYNGYRPNKNGGQQYVWIAPAAGHDTDYTITVKDAKGFNTLKTFSDASGQEKHGVEIDYDIFQDMHAPDSSKQYGVYHASDINFQLNAKGKAIDKGIVLPNVNDHFRGKAPDLGALEAGETVPVYGPRWMTDKNFYR